MTFLKTTAFILLPFSALSLAACGSGSSTGTAVQSAAYVPIFSTSSTDATDVRTHTVDAVTLAVRSADGTFDRSTSRASFDGLDGTIDAANLKVLFDVGGEANGIDSQAGIDYVSAYAAEPFSQNVSLGVVGQPTALSELPTGMVTYTGTEGAGAVIVDGSSVYELTGDSEVVVDFSTSDVAVTLDNLEGTRVDPAASPVAVSDVARIQITGATITDGEFSGGAAEISSTTLNGSLSGGETVEHSGGVFGPGGDEVGGIFVIDDSTASNLGVIGGYVAD